MIRILQMGMTNNLGGIENYLYNYYKNINHNEIQFDFTNIYSTDLCFQTELESSGAKIYKVANYYKHPIKYIKEIKKIIKDNNYEIVHCNMNSAVMLYPLIAAKLGGAKVIIAHSHNSSSDKGILKSLLHAINKQFIPFFATTYFACSNKAGEWFFSKKRMQSKNYYVINNAIDINKYKFEEKIRSKKRKELSIENNTLVLGHVGRFNKQKNHEFIIDIFYEIQKKQRNAKLILVGTGPLFNEIKEKINKLKLNDQVLLLGQRNDVGELYQAMDIFLLPSLYEGLPLVGVEAQCSGLACFFSKTITNEIGLTNNVQYLNINESPKYWAYEILETNIETQKEKLNKINTIEKKGFSIDCESKKLTTLYNKLLKDVVDK